MDLCDRCGLTHQCGAKCGTSQSQATPSSPIYRKRRSIASPASTPGTSGRSTPTLGILSSPDGDGPRLKQQRLSGDFENIFKNQTLEESSPKVEVEDGLNDDMEEEEQEVEPGGASQYPDEEDVDRGEETDGLLIGYAYLPTEVTLPNKFPAPDDLVRVELTPGIMYSMVG